MGFNVGDGLERAVRLYGRATAVQDGDVSYTWGEVGDRVGRLAGALADLGVGAGDQVAIAALNSHRYFELYYGVARLGARVVPLNYRLAPPELVFILNHSESKVLVVDDAFVPLVEAGREHLQSVERFVYAGAGDTPQGMVSYEDAVAAAGPAPQTPVDEDDVYGLYYTGGTTGMPKGVMLTHRNIVSNAFHIVMGLAYTPDDVYLHAAPMFHLADGASTFGVTLQGGGHCFIPAFTPAGTLAAIQGYRPTVSLMVPTMLNMIIHDPGFADHDISSLRRILYGASPMPEELLLQVMQKFPCEIAQGYGMTETAPLLTFLDPAAHAAGAAPDAGPEVRRRLRSCGRECAGVRVRVLDESGAEVKPGQVGEIVATGPNIMKGYWKDPEATAAAVHEDASGRWMHTGDLAEVDDEGYIFIVDRGKDMIISGGENVYSVEVENALYAHPAVLEAAVIGVPDEQWGERVHAVVVPKPAADVTAEEVVAHCHGLIAGYKCPRSVEFKDELPKSGAGKILKRDLRAPYWEDQERQVH